MSQTINITNPKSQYGSLSNNYVGKELRLGSPLFPWKNVTKSIYGRMIYRFDNMINSAKNEDVISLYKKLKSQDEQNVTIEAIREAFEAVFEDYSELTNLLISTGNAPIIYKSQNSFLGSGIDGQGMNVYGKNLEHTRRHLIIRENESKKRSSEENEQQSIYDTYLAYKVLEQKMLDGQNISEYMNKSSSEIVDLLGREQLESSNASKAAILKLADNKGLELITSLSYNQDNLVKQILKNSLKTLRIKKRKERNQIVFDMYADYILEKFYPDLPTQDYEKAKKQEFSSLTWLQRNELEETLYSQYKEGLLSARLSDSIETRLATFYIPTEEEVEQASNMEITYKEKEEQEEKEMYKVTSGNPIYIYPCANFHCTNKQVPEEYKKYLPLSPLFYTKLFGINNFLFPTISLYIMFRLISNIANEPKSGFYLGNIESIYKTFLGNTLYPRRLDDFITNEQADRNFRNLTEQSYKFYSQKYAIEAMDLKFQDRSLQDTLLITGKAKLLFNSENLNLGQPHNSQQGTNFVGDYLMFLREEFIVQRKKETLHVLKTEDINDIISKDVFMKEWTKMRVKDMCKTVVILKNYVYKQYAHVANISNVEYGEEKELQERFKQSNIESASFVELCLNTIYTPCQQIRNQTQDLNLPLDPVFRSIALKECKGFTKASDVVIDVLWRNYTVMLYYLIKTQEDLNSITLKAIIAAVTENLSKKQECVRIVENEYDNCIISALINLLKSIDLFIKNYNYISTQQKVIKANDVNLAASIILNKDKIVKTQKTKDKEKLEKQFKVPEPKPLASHYQEMLAEYELEKQMKGETQPLDPKLPTKQKIKKDKSTLPSPKPVPSDEPESDDLESVSSDDSDMSSFAKALEEDLLKSAEGDQDDDRSSQMEQDSYGEGDGISGDGLSNDSGEGYAPKAFIKPYLESTFDDIEDIAEVTNRIIEMLKVIKLDNMPKIVKNNRINFFATH